MGAAWSIMLCEVLLSEHSLDSRATTTVRLVGMR